MAQAGRGIEKSVMAALARSRIAGGAGGPVKTGNVKIDRLATGLWIAQQGKEWYDKASNKWREETTWTVTVEEKDTAYVPVQRWLLDNLPEKDQRNMLASTHTVYVQTDGTERIGGRGDSLADEFDFDSSSRNRGKAESRVLLSLKEARMQTVMVGSHKVRVRVSSNEAPEDDGRPRRGAYMKNATIMFYCRSLAAKAAVVDTINGMVGGPDKRKPSLWVADGWGNWRSQDAPIRKMESVILKDGIKEDIIADLKKFINDEPKYVELGIPYHRGYVFHGPAGTGKTSMIKALAGELGLDLWYAPLGDLKEDSSLVDLIRSVKARGILLLEDVDSLNAAKDREDKSEENSGAGISTSALLNALDGVVTPHGLITVMTTNHIDKLDPALVRNGRADQIIKMDLPAMNEVVQLWDMFFPKVDCPVESSDEVPGLSQAQFSEIFKSNWDTPDKAAEELVKALAVEAVMGIPES